MFGFEIIVLWTSRAHMYRGRVVELCYCKTTQNVSDIYKLCRYDCWLIILSYQIPRIIYTRARNSATSTADQTTIKQSKIYLFNVSLLFINRLNWRVVNEKSTHCLSAVVKALFHFHVNFWELFFFFFTEPRFWTSHYLERFFEVLTPTQSHHDKPKCSVQEKKKKLLNPTSDENHHFLLRNSLSVSQSVTLLTFRCCNLHNSIHAVTTRCMHSQQKCIWEYLC